MIITNSSSYSSWVQLVHQSLTFWRCKSAPGNKDVPTSSQVWQTIVTIYGNEMKRIIFLTSISCWPLQEGCRMGWSGDLILHGRPKAPTERSLRCSSSKWCWHEQALWAGVCVTARMRRRAEFEETVLWKIDVACLGFL